MGQDFIGQVSGRVGLREFEIDVRLGLGLDEVSAAFAAEFYPFRVIKSAFGTYHGIDEILISYFKFVLTKKVNRLILYKI
jgi:hypothetical protein